MRSKSSIAVFLVIILSILASTHFLIYTTVTRSLDNESPWRLALQVFLVLAAITVPTGFFISQTPLKKKLIAYLYVSYFWIGSFFIFFSLSVIESIIQLIYKHDYSYWPLFAGTIIAVFALYNGLQKPKLKKYQVKGPREMRGFTLVQISDLHVGMLHLNQNWLQDVVWRINSLAADCVCITGDLVEGHFTDISPQLSPLAQLSAKQGLFYITGNHEYIHHTGDWEGRLSELGFTSLHNSHVELTINNDKVMMAGVPDRMVKRFVAQAQSLPDKALASEQNYLYKILLAHEPASVFDIKSEKCDLILSGHTHGGQIFPFHFLVRLVQPVLAGFKVINGINVFAHQGTGFWGPPMRFFSQSEIAYFEWI